MYIRKLLLYAGVRQGVGFLVRNKFQAAGRSQDCVHCVISAVRLQVIVVCIQA